MKKQCYIYFALSSLIITACASNPDKQAKTRSISKSDKIRVIQLGDSHTAGDYFTDELRRQLQAKLGNGGIGLIPPNAVRGQRIATVKYDSQGWETLSSRTQQADFPLGGIITRANKGSLVISSTQGVQGVQNITLSLKPQQANAVLTINTGGKRQTIKGLKAGQWQTAQIKATLPMTLVTQGHQWDVGLIEIERAEHKGAVVSALGINGAQLNQTERWRSDWLNELKQSQANVVILAYGTNEAFNSNLDLDKTTQLWRSTIRNIRDRLPHAKIVVLGAPESLKTTSGRCGERAPMLDAVQTMQQKIASEEKVLFWSWEKAMGGRCSMKNWIAQGLAKKDGVHFSTEGYKTVASRFAQDLLKIVR